MATIHSLVCWGGRTGKTVSLSASTDVVTLTKHGVRNGQKLWPSGTLPSELNSSTAVYGRATGTDTFTLHTSEAGAEANTGQITFAGSSTFAAVVLKSDLVVSPATALSAYGLSDLSRWGSSGSERIYDGIRSWQTARAAASRTDVEVCEIGEAFTEIATTDVIITVPSAGNRIETKINGIRSEGFHRGNFPKSTLITQVKAGGFILFTLDAPYAMLNLSRLRDYADGFTLMTTNGATNRAVDLNTQTAARNMIVYNTTTNGNGVVLRGALSESLGNVIVGWYRGMEIFNGQAGMRAANNLITKCYSPLTTDSAIRGFYYNNIIIGNTAAEWSTQPTSMDHASCNYGPVGNAWMSTDGVRYTIATTDFVDWTNNDFRPASASSPQVDTGLVPYDGLPFDIAGNVRPSYKGGAATEVDGGPFEFDHGYGPWPASHALTLNNVVVGSRILIRDQANTTTHHDAVAATPSVDVTITVYSDARDNWTIKVRKASASPFYQPWETLMTASAGSSSIYVSQIPDE